MKNQQENNHVSIGSLMARIAVMERDLADKDAAIKDLGSIIADKDSAISKLTIDYEAARFQNEQLRRMIYGSKRERFVPAVDFHQLMLEFEPKAAEIADAVKVERELIRVAYERQKPKKEHHGRMVLPSHLTVIEIVIEPSEDTSNMVCIGKEITEELDYTPAKFHINRYIRFKYITKEDEYGSQKQVIAELNRPIPKCMASAALLAMIYTDKFVFHLPLFRILKRIILMGVPLPDSTLESWVKLGARLIQPLYAVHRLYVFSEIYQMIDESPIKVPGLYVG
jgi:transposase